MISFCRLTVRGVRFRLKKKLVKKSISLVTCHTRTHPMKMYLFENELFLQGTPDDVRLFVTVRKRNHDGWSGINDFRCSANFFPVPEVLKRCCIILKLGVAELQRNWRLYGLCGHRCLGTELSKSTENWFRSTHLEKKCEPPDILSITWLKLLLWFPITCSAPKSSDYIFKRDLINENLKII